MPAFPLDASLPLWPRLLARIAAGLIPARASRTVPVASLSKARPPVMLVGAGPGDPRLLTVAAVDAIRAAEVVLYDYLVSPPILDMIPARALRICVGKAKGNHLVAQDDINALLVAHGHSGKRVVRLKGGDPFLFGRGGEEMLALHAAGLSVQVVPGITAALGCGASAGIPVTHRGLAQGVTFVTGHGKDGEPDLNWPALAALGHTLVIYMGLSAAPGISRHLLAAGMGGATPVALVRDGTRPGQVVARGRLDGLPTLAASIGGTGPTLLIIGAVADLGALVTSTLVPVAGQAA